MQNRTVLVFGGAGLVGVAVCRRIARERAAGRVVVASLLESEARAAVEMLAVEHPGVGWVPVWGNLFVPTDLAHLGRGELLGNAAHRARLLDFIYGDFDRACEQNHLARLIREHRPDVVVDCVNTATGISYQDTFQSTAALREDLGRFREEPASVADELPLDLEAGLLSQGIPQIIRHVRFLYQASCDAKTRLYLKIGTTGTGGMGLNIPYTHSEDKPSQVLLAKNAVAFAQTGLLFLMARTPGAPVVKEVKPAALIGYKAIEVRPIRARDGAVRTIVVPRLVDGAEEREHRSQESAAGFQRTGETLELSVVNTGENGVFAKGEFAAITALSQMEFVTPEEIADVVFQEIGGGNTGKDVIAAMDGAVMGPSYRAGLLRNVALKDLQRLEQEHGTPSIALGELGPPELSKLLFEAWLIVDAFGDRLDGLLRDDAGTDIAPEQISARISEGIEASVVGRQAVTVGIPILLPDGRRYLRGPMVKVPEIPGKTGVLPLDEGSIDRWARRGWIDLRPANFAAWQERLRKIGAARQELRSRGSAAVGRESYLPLTLKIGDLVAWVFNNEMGGFRQK